MKLDQLRKAFEAGKLPADKVFQRLEGLVSWRSLAWHRKRRKLRKACCDLCQSKRRLKAVDAWHPTQRDALRDQVALPLRQAYEQEHPLVLPDLPPFDPASVPPPQAEMRECCPWCGSVDIEFKGSPGTWVCTGSRRGRKCGHMFDAPLKRPHIRFSHHELIAQARKARDEALAAPAREWEAGFQQQYRAEIEQKLVEMAFSEWQRYLAVQPEDVKTLCQRCYQKRRIAAERTKAEPLNAKVAKPGARRSIKNLLRAVWNRLPGLRGLRGLGRFLPWRRPGKTE